MTQPATILHDPNTPADAWINALTVELVLRFAGDGAMRVDTDEARDELVRAAADIARRTYLQTRVPAELHEQHEAAA